MAIKIPSKSIYSVENPKIRDNIINRIDIDFTKPTSKYITENTNIYNETREINNPKFDDAFYRSSDGYYDSGYNKIDYYVAYLKTICGYNTIDVLINRFTNNSYVKELFYGISNGTPNISTSITYTKKTIPIKHTFVNGWQNIFTEAQSDIGLNYAVIDETSLSSLTIDTSKHISMQTFSEQRVVPISTYYNNKFGISVSINVKDNSTINNTNIITETTKDNFVLSFDLLTSYKTLQLGGTITHYTDDALTRPDYEDITLEGELIEVVPKTLQLGFNGKTLGISLDTGTLQISSGNKPFKIDNNELLQKTNYFNLNKVSIELIEEIYWNWDEPKAKYKATSNYKLDVGDIVYYENENETEYAEIVGIIQENGHIYYEMMVDSNGAIQDSYSKEKKIEVSINKTINALERQYTNLLEQYKNGKETAIIDCSISEYKDTNGNIVINPKNSSKMLFEMYDIVIPYKQGFVGGVQQEVPLSKYPNGEPKQFQVLGIKPHTRGALRQELTLQEISQNTLQ